MTININRRKFGIALASAAALPLLGCVTGRGTGSSGRVVLYQSIGNKLTQYDVDVEAATLTERASILMPSVVQYAWIHPSRRFLYASTSDAPPGGAVAGKVNRLSALRIGTDGALAMHGEPQVLTARPIHNSVDASGAYALTCYSNPANLTVHRINSDGKLGAQIVQSGQLNMGIFPHQVLSTPAGRSVVMVTRGNSVKANKPEDPGALKLYNFRDGQLSPLANLPVGGRGGYGYGPRHLDFHPSRPWVYVSVERQNQLHMHHIRTDSFFAEPAFIKTTLGGEHEGKHHQVAGAIHVHPRGHAVYVSNRASGTVDFNGKPIFAGGENGIAVFSIDPNSGEPTLVQNADTQSFHPRTFSIDPSGRLLVAATIVDMMVRDGDDVRRVPCALSVFRIAADGRLTFVRKYDLEVRGQAQLWVGMMELAN
ncbi:MAG: beta-propeller fold lactonase family protein [Pseudomonadota bacterium]